MRVVLLLASLLAAWFDWDVNGRVDRDPSSAVPAVQEDGQIGRSLEMGFPPPIQR